MAIHRNERPFTNGWLRYQQGMDAAFETKPPHIHSQERTSMNNETHATENVVNQVKEAIGEVTDKIGETTEKVAEAAEKMVDDTIDLESKAKRTRRHRMIRQACGWTVVAAAVGFGVHYAVRKLRQAGAEVPDEVVENITAAFGG